LVFLSNVLDGIDRPNLIEVRGARHDRVIRTHERARL